MKRKRPLIIKLFIVIDIFIFLCFFVMYGPIDKARVFWVTTAMETGSHRYLANIFYSDEKVKEIMSDNYLIESDEETITDSISIGTTENITSFTSPYEREILEHDKDALYKLIEFKYKEFDCHMVAIYDPKRVEIGYQKKVNQGKVLSDIIKDHDAILVNFQLLQ